MYHFTNLINSKINNIEYIDSSILSNSRTGYVYPSFCDSKITTFTESGRIGYLFQISCELDSVKTKSCFILHERYTKCNNGPVVFTGPNILYDDCVIRNYNEQNILESLEKLLNGESIETWNEIKNEPSYKFKLEVINNVDSYKNSYLTQR
jgi:hypothetical protein